MMRNLIHSSVIVIATLFIYGCGGSSDNKKTPTPPTPPPPPATVINTELSNAVTVNHLYLDGEAQLAATTQGLFWRANADAQWQDRSPNANEVIALAIISQGHYIAAMETVGTSPYAEPSPLYMTQDSGENWQLINHNFGGSEYTAINNIVYDQVNNQLYAVGNTSFAVASSSAENWTLLAGTWDGLASGLALILPHPSQQLIWFGGQGPIENGYLSRYSLVDASVTTWSDLLPNPSVFKGGLIHPTDNKTVLVGGEGGIAISRDNGASWQQPLGDVDHQFYWDIVIDDAGKLYTASYNKGDAVQPLTVLCSSDNGDTWVSNDFSNEVSKGGVTSLLMVQTETENLLYLGLWDNGIKSVSTTDINCG
ncbi:hypothetical protein SAMN05216262_105164 [Colwellia chukchiensis]|uniref:Photosynthesis system II assembly factor Ycf48/Hcf136-like domain-containing protein n=1 Tax=Colwellia chukchiensis TaxID=641665 RepID=A0A1H7MAF6_9GAMM|nr:hypothetical protein [Colwellia chukchiensis]SEL08256.1 hypothetical protein SAMN05216262_105164 [Colwellia chukchiensis]